MLFYKYNFKKTLNYTPVGCCAPLLLGGSFKLFFHDLKFLRKQNMFIKIVKPINLTSLNIKQNQKKAVLFDGINTTFKKDGCIYPKGVWDYGAKYGLKKFYKKFFIRPLLGGVKSPLILNTYLIRCGKLANLNSFYTKKKYYGALSHSPYPFLNLNLKKGGAKANLNCIARGGLSKLNVNALGFPGGTSSPPKGGASAPRGANSYPRGANSYPRGGAWPYPLAVGSLLLSSPFLNLNLKKGVGAMACMVLKNFYYIYLAKLDRYSKSFLFAHAPYPILSREQGWANSSLPGALHSLPGARMRFLRTKERVNSLGVNSLCAESAFWHQVNSLGVKAPSLIYFKLKKKEPNLKGRLCTMGQGPMMLAHNALITPKVRGGTTPLGYGLRPYPLRGSPIKNLPLICQLPPGSPFLILNLKRGVVSKTGAFGAMGPCPMTRSLVFQGRKLLFLRQCSCSKTYLMAIKKGPEALLNTLRNAIKREKCFWNQTFDKGRLKNFVLWFLLKHGEHKTINLVEELKNIGFQYATKAGISLGIEDLRIPKKKYSLIMEAELLSVATIKQYKRGEITGVERFQRLIDTWHRTSERLKQEVIDNFEATDILNPVYMMAFSGARGNISQVRQLVGMRGLMSNPQGQIIDFPIRSNFREGLTLTEYIISSYGARKGIVDTALRTANAGYLTRRLVDVAQHVIISNFDCGTKRGIFLTDMKEGNKTIYSLQNRLIGRVLARDIYNKQKKQIQGGALRNIEISVDLANAIALISKKVFVRSALTCQTKKLVCQLCYGWSLAQGNLVSIGEAVGVVAAQSIGEPGTQLTMRTFHTGGVFSGDISDQIRAPFDGIVEYNNPIAGTLIRTPEGKIAFLTKNEGSFMVHSNDSPPPKKNRNGLQSAPSPYSTSLSSPFLKLKKYYPFRGDKFSRGGLTPPATFPPLFLFLRRERNEDIMGLWGKAPCILNWLTSFLKERRQAKETKRFKIPFYTLLFLRNGEKVAEKEVIAQISLINRQKNATDQAELTIKAELSGQFYSKILDLKENKVGPKIKPLSSSVSPLNEGAAERGKNIRANEMLTEQFNENAVDTIFEAWGWGYAWVLSGKIYQLSLPSSFFPIFGDYINQNTYMNKIHWHVSSSFGSSFKLNRPLNKKFFNKKEIKSRRDQHTPWFHSPPQGGERSDGTFSVSNSKLSLNKKELPLLKNELISFQLSKIVYKKIGYFLKLAEPSSSFSRAMALDNFNLVATGLCGPDASSPPTPWCQNALSAHKGGSGGRVRNAPGSEFFGREGEESAFCHRAHGPEESKSDPLKGGQHSPTLRVNIPLGALVPPENHNSSSTKGNLWASPIDPAQVKKGSAALYLLATEQSSILSAKDTIFLLSSIFTKKMLSSPNNKEGEAEFQNHSAIPKRGNSVSLINSVNPSNWRPSFDIFLNWFPKRLSTKTGGLIFMEPIFFGQKLFSLCASHKSCLNFTPPLPPLFCEFLGLKGGGKGSKFKNNNLIGRQPIAFFPTFIRRDRIANNYISKPVTGDPSKVGLTLKYLRGTSSSKALDPKYPLNIKRGINLVGASPLPLGYYARKNAHEPPMAEPSRVWATPITPPTTLAITSILIANAKSRLKNKIMVRNNSTNSLLDGDNFSNNLGLSSKSAYYFNKSYLNAKGSINNLTVNTLNQRLAKSLLFEQYQQKQFGTLKGLHAELSINKNKNELLTFGLTWKNAFKLNSSVLAIPLNQSVSTPTIPLLKIKHKKNPNGLGRGLFPVSKAKFVKGLRPLLNLRKGPQALEERAGSQSKGGMDYGARPHNARIQRILQKKNWLGLEPLKGGKNSKGQALAYSAINYCPPIARRSEIRGIPPIASSYKEGGVNEEEAMLKTNTSKLSSDIRACPSYNSVGKIVAPYASYERIFWVSQPFYNLSNSPWQRSFLFKGQSPLFKGTRKLFSFQNSFHIAHSAAHSAGNCMKPILLQINRQGKVKSCYSAFLGEIKDAFVWATPIQTNEPLLGVSLPSKLAHWRSPICAPFRRIEELAKAAPLKGGAAGKKRPVKNLLRLRPERAAEWPALCALRIPPIAAFCYSERLFNSYKNIFKIKGESGYGAHSAPHSVIGKVFTKEGVYYFRSFNNNPLNNLRKRKKALTSFLPALALNQSSLFKEKGSAMGFAHTPSILSLFKEGVALRTQKTAVKKQQVGRTLKSELSFLSLKTFSKITSFPNFLNIKSTLFLKKTLLKKPVSGGVLPPLIALSHTFKNKKGAPRKGTKDAPFLKERGTGPVDGINTIFKKDGCIYPEGRCLPYLKKNKKSLPLWDKRKHHGASRCAPHNFSANLKKSIFNLYFYSLFNKNSKQNSMLFKNFLSLNNQATCRLPEDNAIKFIWLRNLIKLLQNKHLKPVFFKNKVNLLKLKNNKPNKMHFKGTAWFNYAFNNTNNLSLFKFNKLRAAGPSQFFKGLWPLGPLALEDNKKIKAPHPYHGRGGKLTGLSAYPPLLGALRTPSLKLRRGECAESTFWHQEEDKLIVSLKALCNLIKRQKFKEICSPYLKDQLCYAQFYTGLNLKNKKAVVLCHSAQTRYKLNLFYNKGVYYSGLNSLCGCRILRGPETPFCFAKGQSPGEFLAAHRRTSLEKGGTEKNLCFVSNCSEFLTFERKRKFHYWFIKSKQLKKIYLKKIINKNKRLYARSSAALLLGRKKKKVTMCSTKNYSLKPFGKIKGKTQLNKKNLLSRKTPALKFANIMVKPGWLYCTTNLSHLFLHNKKLINPGKSIGYDLVFDRHSVYVEIISLDKIALRASKNDFWISPEGANKMSASSFLKDPRPFFFGVDSCPPIALAKGSCLTQAKKLDNLEGAINTFSTSLNHQFFPPLFCGGGKKGVTIKNNKCRFEPQGGAFFDHLAKQNLNGAFKRKKAPPLKNSCLSNDGINNTINDGCIYPEDRCLPSLKKKDKSCHIDKLNSSKLFFVLIRKASEYKLFKDIEHKKEIYKIANQKNNGPALYNLNQVLAPWEGISCHSYAIIRNCYKNLPSKINSLAFAGMRIMGQGPIAHNNPVDPTFFNGRLFISDVLISEFGNNHYFVWPSVAKSIRSNKSHDLRLPKWINKAFNSIHLYSQYKTGLLNKQKITSQTISKFPSSDLKVISNISFYSSLFRLKQATLFHTTYSNNKAAKNSPPFLNLRRGSRGGYGRSPYPATSQEFRFSYPLLGVGTGASTPLLKLRKGGAFCRRTRMVWAKPIEGSEEGQIASGQINLGRSLNQTHKQAPFGEENKERGYYGALPHSPYLPLGRILGSRIMGYGAMRSIPAHNNTLAMNALALKLKKGLMIKEKNIYDKLSQASSWGLPCLPITSLKAINLSPLIISYKASYSLDFPFKTPMRLFSESYKQSLFFNPFYKNNKKPKLSIFKGSVLLPAKQNFLRTDKSFTLPYSLQGPFFKKGAFTPSSPFYPHKKRGVGVWYASRGGYGLWHAGDPKGSPPLHTPLYPARRTACSPIKEIIANKSNDNDKGRMGQPHTLDGADESVKGYYGYARSAWGVPPHSPCPYNINYEKPLNQTAPNALKLNSKRFQYNDLKKVLYTYQKKINYYFQRFVGCAAPNVIAGGRLPPRGAMGTPQGPILLQKNKKSEYYRKDFIGCSMTTNTKKTATSLGFSSPKESSPASPPTMVGVGGGRGCAAHSGRSPNVLAHPFSKAKGQSPFCAECEFLAALPRGKGGPGSLGTGLGKEKKTSFIMTEREALRTGKVMSVLSSVFACPIVEYSLGKDFEKSISFPNNVFGMQNNFSLDYKGGAGMGVRRPIWDLNQVDNKKFLYGSNGPVLGYLNGGFEYNKYSINKEASLYKTEFLSFLNNGVCAQLPFIKTYTYCSFEGELIYRNSQILFSGALIPRKKFIKSQPDKQTANKASRGGFTPPTTLYGAIMGHSPIAHNNQLKPQKGNKLNIINKKLINTQIKRTRTFIKSQKIKNNQEVRKRRTLIKGESENAITPNELISPNELRRGIMGFAHTRRIRISGVVPLRSSKKTDFMFLSGSYYPFRGDNFAKQNANPLINSYKAGMTRGRMRGPLALKLKKGLMIKEKTQNDFFANKSGDNNCIILTKKDQISFYFPVDNYKENYFCLENLKKKNQYLINDIVINFLNILSVRQNNKDNLNIEQQNKAGPVPSSSTEGEITDTLLSLDWLQKYELSAKEGNLANNSEFIFKIKKLPAGMSQQRSKLILGDFLVYGDQISSMVAISKPGQIIHINNKKITIRKGQPIFVSPKAVLHKYDGDFIDEQSSVITLSYQQLKTGDIVQGIPKVEQFFEARTTKRGRLFRDSLSNLLKGLFKRYRSKLPFDQAVRQSFYKIQQIIVDGVQRVYRSQGVSIADKHLEVIVKQMTSKVRIIEGGQTGFFPGEIVDLDFVEQVNNLLMKKIIYEPLVLGITKASLEVDSFLSAASFQQTTRVLSKAAISRKKDFLKGLKENVILGNLIPAGTGYLVYLDQG